MDNISKIKNDDVYKQVISDSFGGIMYNVANYDKYDAEHIIELWDSSTPSEQSSAGGVMRGAISFLKGK